MRRRNLDFFCAVVIVGVLAGVAGLSTTFVLRFVRTSHLPLHFGILLAGVTGSSPVRRAVGADGRCRAGRLWVGGSCAAGPMCAPLAEPSPATSAYRGCPGASTPSLQVLLVGSGASLGREVAPRQFAAALGDFGTGWLKRLSSVTARSCWPVRPGPGWARCMPCRWPVRCSPLRIMLNTWHPARGGRRVDHLEPGRRGRLVRHP